MTLVYPNQKIVKVHKEPADRDHLYGVINKEAAMAALRSLTPNEVKLFMYLSLNQDGYEMALSTADIADRVGATVDGIRAAVNGLKRKGYLINNYGQHYDFYEVPQKGEANASKKDTEKKADQKTDNIEPTTGKSSVCKGQNEGEIIKRDYMKNTSQYTETLSKDNSSQWDEIFKRIKVKCYPHSMKKLKDAAGKELDAHVIQRIVSQNWPAFEKGMEEQEGYRFNTLVNLTSNQYTKWKNIIASEDMERQRAMEESRSCPRINYDNIYRKEPEQKGLGDISALLDECWGDLDDVG